MDIACDFNLDRAFRRYPISRLANVNEESAKKIAEEQAQVCGNLSYCKALLEEARNKITLAYIEGYENCLKKHSNITTLHDYGMLAYQNNNFVKAIELLEECINVAETTNMLQRLDSTFCQDLGSVCIEAMKYENAIKYLSEAINKDPNNKQAYFELATAYFETGNFDEAVQDFLVSTQGKKTSEPTLVPSAEFSLALISSLERGIADAASDFVPSLCSTAMGLGKTLWAAAKDPIGSTIEFSNACSEIGDSLFDYCKSVDWNTVDDCVEDFRDRLVMYNQLNDAEKGDLIGYSIGNYGVDFVAGAAAAKGVAAYRKLREVNRVYNLEAMTLSQANKESIIASSLKHEAERREYFKNVPYNYDAHNKHVLGHNDYDGLRSIVDHPDPKRLVKEYGGTGIRHRGCPGSPGYKEAVDFNERIGIWKSEDGIRQAESTRGCIHYGKKGAHIVTSDPDPTIMHKVIK